MLIVLLFCCTCLLRSAEKLCSTQDSEIFSSHSTSGNGPSLLQTTGFRQGAAINLSLTAEDPFYRTSTPQTLDAWTQDRRNRRSWKEMQKPTSNASLKQLANEMAIRRGGHQTKDAAFPHVDMLFQKHMDGTIQKKGVTPPAPPPPVLPTHPDPEPTHVAEKCLTRKSVSSNLFSLGQSCCAATTQVAACLDGYILHWSEKKCALGADWSWAYGKAFESSSSLFSMNSYEAGHGLGAAGARTFTCHPPPNGTDNNGPREGGIPGTEHRRRWKYNQADAEGKTGSCCGWGACSSCEEGFNIQNTHSACGFGEYWLCASQHR